MAREKCLGSYLSPWIMIAASSGCNVVGVEGLSITPYLLAKKEI